MDWFMNDANPNTIEFIYKHSATTNTQEILMSSGSGPEPSVAVIDIQSNDTSYFDDRELVISSSDGTGKTYIFDDDSDGATGTIDSSGRVRIQINGISNVDDIVTQVSASISSTNGHANKIKVIDGEQLTTSDGNNFITSDGKTFYVNYGRWNPLLNSFNISSGSLILTQVTASATGNKLITTTTPSASVTGFMSGSNAQNLWDLRLIPDNEGISSSFAFR
jgi:hypothetical protein